MQLETFKNFPDFALLDTGAGFRLEQWGPYRLMRPDPQIIWPRHLPDAEWDKADATFHVTGEQGRWVAKTELPPTWPMRFGDVQLIARLTPFKHTGIFAEQAANWEWMGEKLTNKNRSEKLQILNLFAYTGSATMVLTKLGCMVTHIDASKPALTWARENQRANGFPEDAIRWILDDAVKFVQREVKRGKTYDGILMDPPAFGHSPTGKTWKFNKDLPKLLANCVQLLSPKTKFLLINGYATNSSALSVGNLLQDAMAGRKGALEYGELCLKQTDGRLISTGIFARWSA